MNKNLLVAAAWVFLLSGVNFATGQLDQVQIERSGQSYSLAGEIVVEAQDGGVLFLSDDSRLWLIQPEEIKSKSDTKNEFKPLDADALAKATLKDLPDGFQVYKTKHFVICYNTSKAYAKWVGSIYERLYRGFRAYWTGKRKWKIAEPKGPLPIILFANKEQYARYVKRELNQEVGSMIAYYHLLTNRVAMYDLTGFDKPTEKQIKQFLRAPNSLRMIATVVHEGTHQLVFNTGIQVRLADTPLWVNEGMAMYFETPDVGSTSGWRKIGVVNRPRLQQFRANLSVRKYFPLKDFIADDVIFRSSKTATDAYAQAWALNYYLFKKKSKNYVKYLQHLSKKQPLRVDGKEKRVEEFKKFFGDDLSKFEREFLRYMRGVR